MSGFQAWITIVVVHIGVTIAIIKYLNIPLRLAIFWIPIFIPLYVWGDLILNN